ncbi:hypothetical protein GW17_00028096, partial [Ensete ventricosum]
KPQSSVDSSSAKSRSLFLDKNRASLLHPSPAPFSFEDPKIRVPLYAGVHVVGLAALSLNLTGTCRCHRWRRQHYRLKLLAIGSLFARCYSHRSNNSVASPLRRRSPSASTS